MHNFSFVIASVSEAIPNKLKDCHVAIAPRNDAKRHVAFTLAEVLITLAIIGVVSAMTIPTLITKYQKMIIEKRITQDYSIIQQAIRLQIANGLDVLSDNVTNDGSDLDSSQKLKTWYDEYWAPYLKTSKVCIESSGCWQSKGHTKALSGQTAENSRIGVGIGGGLVTIRLQNGTSICMNVWRGGSASARIGINTAYDNVVMFVDANGDSLPNVIGKDIYVFVWTKENGLVPAGYNTTATEIRENCNKNATGIWAGSSCLARVKLDGWKILDEVWKAGN